VIKFPQEAGSAVLVTGAAGFIGSHLVDQLLASGHRVIGLDRRDVRTDLTAGLHLAEAIIHPRFSWVHRDLLQVDLSTILHDVECVFHLAAVPGVRKSWGRTFPDYVSNNIRATERLAAACVHAGVPRLVYASSSSVYGQATAASRETDPVQPISPYGITKLAGEQLCLAYARRPGSRLRVSALRYFTVYGPRQRPDMAISRLLAAALTGAQYTLFGDGTQRREFTFVSDVVDATVAAADLGDETAVINLGGGSSISIIDLLSVAREVTGAPVFLTAVEAHPGDVVQTWADLSVARQVLGYEPRVDLLTGMRHHGDWLRALLPPVRGRLRHGDGRRAAQRAAGHGHDRVARGAPVPDGAASPVRRGPARPAAQSGVRGRRGVVDPVRFRRSVDLRLQPVPGAVRRRRSAARRVRASDAPVAW
jgi:nucleoside-diphosphate-sugar epimerase